MSQATHDPVIETSLDREGQGWVCITVQDNVAAGEQFPAIRKLLAGQFMSDTYNIAISLYNKEPREYPPRHFGSGSAGLNLNREQATALRNALNEWLVGKPPTIEEEPV